MLRMHLVEGNSNSQMSPQMSSIIHHYSSRQTFVGRLQLAQFRDLEILIRKLHRQWNSQEQYLYCLPASSSSNWQIHRLVECRLHLHSRPMVHFLENCYDPNNQLHRGRQPEQNFDKWGKGLDRYLSHCTFIYIYIYARVQHESKRETRHVS